jgi:hypothetical protein
MERLQLSQVREKGLPFVGRDESAIYDESVGRQNRREIWPRIQPRRASEEGHLVIQDFVERRGGVVMKVRRGSADTAQLCGVHHAEVTWLARQQQPAGI